MLNRRASTARLRCEPLEGRLTPAGTVVVDVTGSSVKITGDDQENDISVFVDNNPTANTLHIVGNNGTGVTINDPLPAGDAVGKLTIDLKKAAISTVQDPRGTEGVDTVNVHDIFLGGNLLIKGKNGGVVTVNNVYGLKATIDFHAGNGISTVDQTKGPLGSNIKILNSNLGFDGRQSPPKQLGVTVLTKDCKDHVEVRATTVQGSLTIRTKGENDDIGLFGVYNFFGTSNFGITGLNIDAGTGDDFFAASGIDVIKGTNIKMGDGNDKVLIGRFEGFGSNLFRSNVSIDLGKGDDVIGIGHTSNPDNLGTSFGAKLTVKGGIGDDKLMIGNQVTLSAAKHSIDGGPQTTADALEVLTPPFDPNDKIFKNWETRGGFVAANLSALVADEGTRF
ncbi:MAG TPA: hypothetical protein VHR66_06550 [Gemmataceae bacterium]|nr:hypothetical protein [Gemmataceae bacterium]